MTLTASGKETRSAERTAIPSGIDLDEVRHLISLERAQLVEVLPASSYNALHLPGAVSVPLKQLDGETTAILDRDRPIITYCYDYQ